jgi:hypothetical protein
VLIEKVAEPISLLGATYRPSLGYKFSDFEFFLIDFPAGRRPLDVSYVFYSFSRVWLLSPLTSSSYSALMTKMEV